MKLEIIIYVGLLFVFAVTTLIAFFRQSIFGEVISGSSLSRGIMKNYTMSIVDMIIDGKGMEEQRHFLLDRGISEDDCDNIIVSAEKQYSRIIQDSEAN